MKQAASRIPDEGLMGASGTATRPRWWVVGLLSAAVLAFLGTSPAAGGHHGRAAGPPPRDVAVTVHEAGVAGVVPTRSTGRLLAEPSLLRALGPADIPPYGAAPSAIRQSSFARSVLLSGPDGQKPRTRPAPGVGDRAPPSR